MWGRLGHFVLSWPVTCMEDRKGRGQGKQYCSLQSVKYLRGHYLWMTNIMAEETIRQEHRCEALASLWTIGLVTVSSKRRQSIEGTSTCKCKCIQTESPKIIYQRYEDPFSVVPETHRTGIKRWSIHRLLRPSLENHTIGASGVSATECKRTIDTGNHSHE